jgi:pimeloyl-ACP methyl ester carboxylesterase
MQPQEVNLITSDETQIAGTYIPGSLSFGAVLLHMMPADKSSFDDLSQRLSQIGFHTLAIDLRGHGESSGGDYQSFSDEQHQKSIFDVMVAVEYLRKQDPEMKIGLVGASIGANLAMQYAAANPVSFLVLLSPGLNYRGVETGRLAVALPDLPVYFMSALDDPRVEGNAAQTETLYNACASQKKTINILRQGGHGTDMINNNKELATQLVEWIREAASQTPPPPPEHSIPSEQQPLQ